MKQFGTLDGLDNRKAIVQMFERLGHGASEEVAAARRANVVQELLSLPCPEVVQNAKPANPLSAVEAYLAFVGMTGVLLVDPDAAAQRLENIVRGKHER